MNFRLLSDYLPDFFNAKKAARELQRLEIKVVELKKNQLTDHQRRLLAKLACDE